MTTDAYLRMRGFRIESRPRDREPQWRTKTGRVVPQSVALVIAANEDKAEGQRHNLKGTP